MRRLLYREQGEMKTSPCRQTIAGGADCAASALTIQQAEKLSVGGEQFLQIAEPNPQTQRHKLTRVPFRVSRLMEFCSIRELQNQTGHDVWDWLLVVLKELLDNALDAARRRRPHRSSRSRSARRRGPP